jgi:2-oxoglutarate ferredoxin oxidoreductase subunit alpha
MVGLRAQKVARIADVVEDPALHGESSGEILVVSWGSTYGAIHTAVSQLIDEGKPVAHINLRWINPLPNSLGQHLANFRHILVPELNMGQLLMLIRSRYLVDAIGFNKVQGLPFTVGEIRARIMELLGDA